MGWLQEILWRLTRPRPEDMRGYWNHGRPGPGPIRHFGRRATDLFEDDEDEDEEARDAELRREDRDDETRRLEDEREREQGSGGRGR